MTPEKTKALELTVEELKFLNRCQALAYVIVSGHGRESAPQILEDIRLSINGELGHARANALNERMLKATEELEGRALETKNLSPPSHRNEN